MTSTALPTRPKTLILAQRAMRCGPFHMKLLTPIGGQLVDQWEAAGRPDSTGSLLDYLLNARNRWLRLPTWLS